ncbi:MAG: hypothetical protein SGBAC_011294 [Bacillariaceae sp.]
MTRKLIEEAFGGGGGEGRSADAALVVDLYKDVLQCPKDASNAQLRKAYYKRARDFHPDKNKEESAKIQFQAISFAYNYLKDAERRKDYDEEGILPDENEIGDNDDDNENNESKPNDWKAYFDLIFGSFTSTQKIDDFEMKYKMSLEEEADVLKYYEQFQGNLVKCLEFVMLSQERDVKRWMEDYIQPAIDEGKVSNSYEANLKSSMAKIDKKLAKQQQKKQRTSRKRKTTAQTKETSKPKATKAMEEDTTDEEDEEEEEAAIDEDETESEDSDLEKAKKAKKAAPKKSVVTTKKKAKPAPPVRKRRRRPVVVGGCGPSDGLVAAIRGRQQRGNASAASERSLFATLGARYGVDMGEDDDDDDPLDDAAFAKIQSKLKKKKTKGT